MNEYLFYCTALTMTREEKMSIHVQNGYNLLPSRFQFTIGRIMDAALADTGPAVTLGEQKLSATAGND